MVKYKFVLAAFPFDDFSTLKVRPALCLTNSIGSYKHIVIAFITSKTTQKLETTDILIPKSDRSFRKTGLVTDSVIRLHRVISMPSSLIKRELGVLPKKFRTEVDSKLKELFQL